MSKKYARAGGKFTGTHTTLIPAACTVADIADGCATVYRISPGFIKAGLRSSKGQRRLKMTSDGNYILLAVRDNSSQQEIHVYARDAETAQRAIAQGASDAGMHVSFGKT